MAVIPIKDREDWFDVVVYQRATSPGAKGKRVTRRVKGKRKAERLERDLTKARDEGRVIGTPPTLADFIARYHESRRHEVSAQTLHGYQSIATRYIAPDLGTLPLSAVTSTEVRAFYGRLVGRGLSAGTVAGVHRVLSMALKAAVDDRLTLTNPCQVARPPKSQTLTTREDERGLEPDEARRLLRDLRGTQVYVPAAVALATGVRRGEVLALKWEDIDIKRGELHVRAALEQVGKAVTRRDPKTERSRRTVPFGAQTAALLSAHLRAQNETRLRSRFFWRDEGYVFPSERITQSEDGGRVWTPDAFAQAWRRAINEVNGKRLGKYVLRGGKVEDFDPLVVGFHDLRHTCATIWLANGVRDEEVSRRLGHSSSVITRRVYSHVLRQESRDGVDATDALLGL